MSKVKLSARELDIMTVLWNSTKPLAATDIPKADPSLNVNTVLSSIKNLLKKSYIEVADIVYHGTVLTRTFRPVLTQEEYLSSQFFHFPDASVQFMASLVKAEQSDENLLLMEKLIKDKRKELQEKGK